MTTKAQNASSVKSAKTVELNALLKTKKWSISDIARYIPYNISMVDASFNTWLKSREIVFYKEVNGQKKLVLPEEVDKELKNQGLPDVLHDHVTGGLHDGFHDALYQ
jgi:hypothetical protein